MSKNYRKSKLLVPECYDALTQFKLEVAKEIGHFQFCKENNDHYKGDLTSRQNGLEGGPIGGEMVKRMIAQFKNNLA
ncbi:MAG: alpha/beta-type small acid-soluble spore protein [Clostridiaceae bacterium]|nr:alpha/beta-type small acid-soluble spore protein [Clostridiaceae bacterium]